MKHACALLVLLIVPCMLFGQGAWYGGPFTLCVMPNGLLPEASGIVASRKNADVVWLNNDSGDGPKLYALTTRGKHVGTIELRGAKNIDWEDVAYGPGPVAGEWYLYAGDIGDNEAKRPSITVYRIAEPVLSSKSSERILPASSDAPDVFTFTYPDGARDAEALIVDPLTQDIFIITKRERQSRVYRASAPHKAGSSRVLEFVTALPMSLITAGDVSADGSKVLLKNYLYAYHWVRKAGEKLSDVFKREATRVTYMPEIQGEAICFAAKADGFYTTSEREDGGSPAPIYFYPRVNSAAEARKTRDAKIPQIEVEPSADTPGIYTLRYVIPEVSRVEVAVFNAIMMKVIDVASESGEAGVQEREIDLIDHPSGQYVAVIRTNQSTVMCPIEHKKP